MDLEQLRVLARDEHGLCTVSVVDDDGAPHASVVNAGMLAHPRDHGDVLGFVTRGGSVKHRLLRQRPRAAVTFRRRWRWAGIVGDVELIGPDEPAPEVDVAALLRDVFVAAGGTHDDWDEYDKPSA
ncbi:MAG: pyridoxamine 5'-phosphate oxidase family protein [Actinobacteria bacterium]|nr:pyridoxamine 5'-phosphate oxidase family protein [Actinomycetota bacterium]